MTKKGELIAKRVLSHVNYRECIQILLTNLAKTCSFQNEVVLAKWDWFSTFIG